MTKPNVTLCVNGPDGFDAYDLWALRNAWVWRHAHDEAAYLGLSREQRLEWTCVRLLEALEHANKENINRAMNAPYIIIKPTP